jgi:hypothetical protein
MRWTDHSLVIVVAIFAVIVVAVGIRRAPGVPSPRTADAGVEEWESYLVAVDRAVEANDIGLASRLWRNAYGAALESRRWKPMLATGQAALRVGHAGRTMGGFDAQARQCYLAALFRARDQHSIDGVLLVAEAFAQLGDIEAARGAVRMADRLAQLTREAPRPERLTVLRSRMDIRVSAARQSPPIPFFISPASAIFRTVSTDPFSRGRWETTSDSGRGVEWRSSDERARCSRE